MVRESENSGTLRTSSSSFSSYKWENWIPKCNRPTQSLLTLPVFSHHTKSQFSTPPPTFFFFSQIKHQSWRLKSSSGMSCPYLLPCLFFPWRATSCTDIPMSAKRNTQQIWWVLRVVGGITTHLQEDRKGGSRTDINPLMGRVSFKWKTWWIKNTFSPKLTHQHNQRERFLNLDRDFIFNDQTRLDLKVHR